MINKIKIIIKISKTVIYQCLFCETSALIICLFKIKILKQIYNNLCQCLFPLTYLPLSNIFYCRIDSLNFLYYHSCHSVTEPNLDDIERPSIIYNYLVLFDITIRIFWYCLVLLFFLVLLCIIWYSLVLLVVPGITWNYQYYQTHSFSQLLALRTLLYIIISAKLSQNKTSIIQIFPKKVLYQPRGARTPS